MEIIKKIVKVGNSAGVLLPKEWQGGEAKVILLEKPIKIEEDLFKILTPYLTSILGIYLTGSYSRNEQTSNSDIDVVVISSDINKRFKQGKYEIIITSLETANEVLQKNLILLYPMLLEAKVILNNKLLDDLLKLKIKRKALKWHLETSQSSLNIVKSFLDLDDELEESGGLVYPLILRLRGIYLIDCIINNRAYFKKNFLNLLSKNTEHAAEIYKVYESDKRSEIVKVVRKEDLYKLYILAMKMLEEQKKYVKNSPNADFIPQKFKLKGH
ncbi:MAG: DUF2080 family transposase-associated protein [Nanoarchaeota archaeon]